MEDNACLHYIWSKEMLINHVWLNIQQLFLVYIEIRDKHEEENCLLTLIKHLFFFLVYNDSEQRYMNMVV